MAVNYKQVADALAEFSTRIRSTRSDGLTLREASGWNFPHLSADNIGAIVEAHGKRVARIDPSRIDPKRDFSEMVTRINRTAQETPQNLWNGGGAEAFRTITALLDWVEAEFSDYYEQHIDWEAVKNEGLVPRELASRLRSLEAQVKKLDSSAGSLESKIKVIVAAHDAAIALPTDLAALEEARQVVQSALEDCRSEKTVIQNYLMKSETYVAEIYVKMQEAVKLVERTEDAYSAATTKGLGASFEERAISLARSMWVWVAGLAIALLAGAVLGYLRISKVEDLVTMRAFEGVIWLNAGLAVLSVTAPVWFAWVATKQIGHRFKLAEDYAFKASVAKAYEGYRREAARLDPDFARRLFASALERLDEAPLRYVESQTYGSPGQEVLEKRPTIRAVVSKAAGRLRKSVGKDETSTLNG